MEEAFTRLRTAGVSLVGCHGGYPLYRRFGFDVFTHHCGIFITPEQIEFMLGREIPDQPQKWVKISQGQFILDDLLLVFRSHSRNSDEARQVLLSAAVLARQNQKSRILFEHPEAPSYGSTYPIYKTPETPLSELARACGGKLVLQGANPEEGPVPDADWLKVLDAPMLLQRALECLGGSLLSMEPAQLWLETDAGSCLLESTGSQVRILPDKPVSVIELHWTTNAISQLITGYHSVEVLSSLYQTRLPDNIQVFLERLFPPVWRFSRNESWTYKP
jgi:hypothetical protein